MASTSMTIDEESNRGSMWALDQKLDQPMDEEAGRLRNMYMEKVRFYIKFFFFILKLLLLDSEIFPFLCSFPMHSNFHSSDETNLNQLGKFVQC